MKVLFLLALLSSVVLVKGDTCTDVMSCAYDALDGCLGPVLESDPNYYCNCSDVVVNDCSIEDCSSLCTGDRFANYEDQLATLCFNHSAEVVLCDELETLCNLVFNCSSYHDFDSEDDSEFDDTEFDSEDDSEFDDTEFDSEDDSEFDDTELDSEDDSEFDDTEFDSEDDSEFDDTEFDSEDDSEFDDTEFDSEDDSEFDDTEFDSEDDSEFDDTEFDSEDDSEFDDTEFDSEDDSEFDSEDDSEFDDSEFDSEDDSEFDSEDDSEFDDSEFDSEDDSEFDSEDDSEFDDTEIDSDDDSDDSETDSETDSDTDSETDSDTNSETDSDTDSETDSDTNSETDSDTNSNFDSDDSDVLENSFSVIFCYYAEETCDLLELLQQIGQITGQAAVATTETCNNFENYCDDIGAWEDDKKRQFSEEDRRSVQIISFGYSSLEEASEGFENLQTAVDEGEVDGATAISELNCGECENVCNDCEVNGEWHVVQDTDCEDLNDCPDGEGDLEIEIRTVLKFDGDNERGDDEELEITQYWDFGSHGSCTGAWDATYRFYSDATQCRIRTLEIRDCNLACDSSVSDGLSDMVCRRDNLVLDDELSDASFSSACQTLNYQDTLFQEGDGDDIDILPGDSGASASVPFGFGVLVVCLAILGVWF